ncbi:hypothetical protein T4E_5758 [Trichinella pseudospiralis]|uniref:Uncharacterized protein n=1 Tax=Trichinella pseudospiralis TaxID=6337 RepID=A0A0V0XT62_TRIPS|nr:hypothetical protein T4E_5758 [Trichinella pseudospiralis]
MNTLDGIEMYSSSIVHELQQCNEKLKAHAIHFVSISECTMANVVPLFLLKISNKIKIILGSHMKASHEGYAYVVPLQMLTIAI